MESNYETETVYYIRKYVHKYRKLKQYNSHSQEGKQNFFFFYMELMCIPYATH